MEPYGLVGPDDRLPGRDREGGPSRLEVTPDQVQGQPQSGSWTIVSGTEAFEGMRGSGEMETTYDDSDDSLTHETLTGTATR